MQDGEKLDSLDIIKERYPVLNKDIQEILATNTKSLEIYELLTRHDYKPLMGRINEYLTSDRDSRIVLDNGKRYIIGFNGVTLPITRGENLLLYTFPMENKETTGSGILVERLGHEIVNARYMSRDCPHVLCQRIMDIIIHD